MGVPLCSRRSSWGTLRPAVADPAYLHVTVRGRYRYLSTPSLDGAANRLGRHDPLVGDRKRDRDPSVGRGRLQRGFEILGKVGGHLSVRGLKVDLILCGHS